MQKENHVEVERAQLLSEVAGHLGRHEWTRAYQIVIQKCLDSPESGPTWELRGLLESHLDLRDEAISSLEHASLLAPLQPLASRCLALEYLAKGKHRLGVELLASLASVHSDPSLIRLISHDLLRAADYEASFRILTEALTQSESALLWHELSATLNKLGSPRRESLSAALRAVAMEPKVACFRVTAATLYIGLEQPREAYEMVRVLSDQSIRQLRCVCCLWRLICIFDCFESPEKVRVCYQHMRCISDIGHGS